MEKEHLEILLEDIRGKFDLVLEGHDTLHKEIRDTREELGEKINLVDFKVETLNRKIDGVEESLNRKIDGVEESLNRRIDGVEESLNRKIDGVRDELGQKIDAVAADLTAHRADTEIHQAHYGISEKKD
jgi:archaellum component FlaC